MSKTYIGIDLATTWGRTGIVVLRDDGSGLKQLKFTTTRKFAKDFSSSEPVLDVVRQFDDEEVIVAIDVPFGYPKHFAEWVRDFDVAKPHTKIKSELRHRATEHALIAKGMNPLSASMDKLGATLVSGREIISALKVYDGFEVSRGKVPTNKKWIIEIYPKASVIDWGNLPVEIDFWRPDFLNALADRLNLAFKPNIADQNEHEADALIAALTAWNIDQDLKVGELEVRSDSDEGYIWLPQKASRLPK